MPFQEILSVIDSAPLYRVALYFYGIYPITMALVWIIMAAVYFRRREVKPSELAPADYLPLVSVVIPAFEEEDTIGRTLEAVLALEYPNYEVVVVNDGSETGPWR